MNGYQKFKDDYIEQMSRDQSVASDGKPLANHFLVMTLKNQSKIRDAFLVKDQTILPFIGELIQTIADLNFPDKNPNNHNILYLHEEKLGCANNLFQE